jgi:hypothetical protein
VVRTGQQILCQHPAFGRKREAAVLELSLVRFYVLLKLWIQRNLIVFWLREPFAGNDLGSWAHGPHQISGNGQGKAAQKMVSVDGWVQLGLLSESCLEKSVTRM